MIEFILNHEIVQTSLSSGSTVLDFVRYQQRLTGTKIGCREGDCGACTVLVGEPKDGRMEYQSMTSCLMPLGNAHGKHIVTIEGLNLDDLNPVQSAIVENGGTQCGFCTVGFVVSLCGACLNDTSVNYESIMASMDGNICRCTGYKSLERSAADIHKKLMQKDLENPLQWLADNSFIPKYFTEIPHKLTDLRQRVHTDAMVPENGQSNGDPKQVKVGGGTDLYVQRPEEMVQSDVDHIFDWAPLKGIERSGKRCSFGAATTAEEIRRSEIFREIFPGINEYMKLISSTPIRNMGTVGGNFINASPIGDLTIFFLALDSGIVLSDGKEERSIKLRDFYLGYKNLNKTREEFIKTIYFDIPDEKSFFNFEKVSKRTHLDIASVNSAICVRSIDNKIIYAHVSAGGVAPVPLYLAETSRFLEGKEIIEENIVHANNIAQEEISPISDARGTSEYKRLLLRQLLYAHFMNQFSNLELEPMV